jgi:Protein kinase domain/NACHT domain
VPAKDGAFEELGRGAMGVTYKAFDTILEHAVALKVIDARIAARADTRERFLREARAAAQLRHPNVASVFYYGRRKGDGQCFYAMELVEGETLEARLRREGPLPVSLALEVTSQVAKALTAAEAQGLVHRDLKPSNLMLANGPELTVKLIDFGLAKARVVDDEADLTHGGFVGTPAFASPEQCAGSEVDVRSDLYALGITLWQMLTGQAPFRGSRAEVMRQHLQAPLPLEQLKGLPQSVAALLHKLLEKDQARRFQSPAELMATVTAGIASQRTPTYESLQQMPSADPHGATRKSHAQRGPERISVARLPVTGKEVFGREENLAFLDAVWADPQVNVVSVVAWAGVGKSTLVNHWLRRLAAEQYRSADLIFGWSFYRQGTSGGASSADEFLDVALAWFGDVDPRLGTAWDKGERLARLIAPRRTLLVLDGLEPLQNPPGSQEGRLREASLQALLRELAAFNVGLCVITTRLVVADLTEHEGSSARRLNLEHLSDEAGATLLRALGVRGSEAELRTASNEFDGHCLALTLLGSYLTDAYRGDISYREEVSSRLAHDVRQGAHARKVMASYQDWFGEGPELSVLRLLGFFDRPADERTVGTLLKPPAIAGLTESLTNLNAAEWRATLARLRRASLLAEEDPLQPGQLDAHPLVREYFDEQLRSQRTAAWKEGNRRLYEHYRALTPPLPDSFRDMEPLFLAVSCGCQAGLYRDALHEVYLPRIQRGDASFAAKVLGAHGALLSALVHFFEDRRWGSAVQGGVAEQCLTAEDQLLILMQAGMYLTATRGMGAPEARLCYERAESLCHSLNRPMLLYSALMGQYLFSFVTDRLTATMQISQRVYSLAQGQNNITVMVGACGVLAAPLYFMGEFETARPYARRGVQLWRTGSTLSQVQEINAPAVLLSTPAVICLCFEALCEWHLGEIDSCERTVSEAISLAKELDDAYALTESLFFATMLGHFGRKPAEVERLASDLIELSTHHHFALYAAGGEILRGWARSASGNTMEGLASMEGGIRDWQATGSRLVRPLWLALKAEGLHLAVRTPEALEAIKEAEALAERFEERWWCVELHRLRGVFLAAMGTDEAQIESSFCEAIRIAKEQKSISLEKRAEETYAEYRRQKMSVRADGF